MFTSVYGATVTVSPRTSITNPGVQFKNQYGYLNSTNTQVYSSFTVYANGTMFFDMTGQDKAQGTYSYIVKSFGNGTLNMVFKVDEIPNVLTAVKSLSASYSSSKGSVIVQYSANVASDPLVIGFAGQGQLGPLFASTILGLGAFLAFVPFLAILSWIKGGKVEDQKPFIMMMIILFSLGVAMAMVGAFFLALPTI